MFYNVSIGECIMQSNNPNQQQNTVYVAESSFTTKAIITLVLYIFFYIPGLIANFIFWNEAQQIKNRTGNTPAGTGCLTAMLIGQAIVVGLFCIVTAIGMATS
jgi:TRAP-type mannitol/chloroaromatic compound transport system permease small subunit